MDNITDKNLSDYIAREFPEFVESAEYDVYNKALPYVFLADFCRFFLYEHEKNHQDIVSRFFDFINKIYAKENLSPALDNLLGVECLESFLDAKYYDLAKNRFTGKAREEYLKMYHEGFGLPKSETLKDTEIK